ncbi:hypothetical protein J0H58_29785 [bacterium]|nr:hypothetical protein [bacterium]
MPDQHEDLSVEGRRVGFESVRAGRRRRGVCPAEKIVELWARLVPIGARSCCRCECGEQEFADRLRAVREDHPAPGL